jgi:hypothetical protein
MRMRGVGVFVMVRTGQSPIFFMTKIYRQLNHGACTGCAVRIFKVLSLYPSQILQRRVCQPKFPKGAITSWVRRLALLLVAQLGFQGTMKAGQVIAYSFHSQTLGRDWHYNAYLPDGYEHSNLRYPVLFMLHGYSENENAWVTKGHH